MTRDPNTPTDTDPELPSANDPGGAHGRGYSADAAEGVPDVPEPIPLVDAPPGGIHVAERDDGVRPTGRSPDPTDPNNRIVSPE